MSDRDPSDASHTPGSSRSKRSRRCPESAQLQEQLDAIEAQLDELIASQSRAFEANDQAKFWQINQEIALIDDRRLQLLDALRGHVRDHGCR
jgi:hypothetical protein